MELIDKAAVIAEIEKVIDEPTPPHDPQCPWEDGYLFGLSKAESIIDTLETKKVDLDLEIILWANAIPEIRLDDIERIAKYFYELGIKSKRE